VRSKAAVGSKAWKGLLLTIFVGAKDFSAPVDVIGLEGAKVVTVVDALDVADHLKGFA
jgi:hypothetical protein